MEPAMQPICFRERIRRLLVPSLCAAALSHVSLAHADYGDGLGIGPVIAWSSGGSWSIGWEAAAMYRIPLLKASVGGIYSIVRQAQEPAALHYLAYEPGLILGGTAGVALADVSRVQFMYGAWGGFPLPLTDQFIPGERGPSGAAPHAWLLTLTIGWRSFGGMGQLYVAPKVWSFSTYVFNT
jgi:hypothetical protein